MRQRMRTLKRRDRRRQAPAPDRPYTLRRADTHQFYVGADGDDIRWGTASAAKGYATLWQASAMRQALLALGLPVYVCYEGKRL